MDHIFDSDVMATDSIEVSGDKPLTEAQLAQRAKKRERAHARRKEKKNELQIWDFSPKKQCPNT